MAEQILKAIKLIERLQKPKAQQKLAGRTMLRFEKGPVSQVELFPEEKPIAITARLRGHLLVNHVSTEPLDRYSLIMHVPFEGGVQLSDKLEKMLARAGYKLEKDNRPSGVHFVKYKGTPVATIHTFDRPIRQMRVVNAVCIHKSHIEPLVKLMFGQQLKALPAPAKKV